MHSRPKNRYKGKLLRAWKRSEWSFKIQSFFARSLPISQLDSSMNGDLLSSRLTEVCKSKKVVEFGSGGSTILLAEVSSELISIESDKRFATLVNERLAILRYQSHAFVKYANIGPTKSFGQPFMFLKPIFKYRYKNYVKIFDSLESYFQPDIVFVDGRFRVYCSIRACQEIKNDFLLIIDDYFDRPEYHEIEKILGSANIFSENTAYFQVRPESLTWGDSSNFLAYRHDYR